MNYEAVSFDFNGTLVKDGPYHVEAWSRISEELGNGPVSRELMDTRYSGMPNAEILKLMKPGQSDEFYALWSEKKEAYYREAFASTPGGPHLVTGAEELFGILKAHQILFNLCSASIASNIRFYRETFHLDQWIDPDLIVYDDGSYENKITMYEESGRRMHAGTRLLIFEDALSGIRSASALSEAGLIVMRMKNLESVYPSYPKILRVIDDFTGILPDIMPILLG